MKKLITTCYKNQNFDLFSQHKAEKSVGLVYAEKENNTLNEQDIEVFHLDGDGDFRSRECVELLKQCDIVATNPPFSLFREYVALLMEYEKKFVIIGNKNAITYKEIFRLIKEDSLWVGNTPMSKDMLFDVPQDYADELVATKKEGSAYKRVDGVVKGRSQSIWFTNLDNPKRHEDLILYKKYSPDEYPKYDNYDAIEVSKTKNIPIDYDGAMGVPITFLDKYNPEQFKIVGCAKRGITPDLRTKIYTNHDSSEYSDLNAGPALRTGKNYKRIYARILIRKRGMK